jgi:ketosteroid isomerase-like protein
MQQEDASEVLEAFQLYAQAFQALDARAVAQHFHEPAFFITPKDVRALPTTAAVEQTYGRVMADMPPEYARTEFGPLSVHRLGDDLAIVSGHGVWKNAANDDLMPFGMTSQLRP